MKDTYDYKDKYEELYLDYVNNFLTVGAFADHYDLSEMSALYVIEWGRKEHNDKCFDAIIQACKEDYALKSNF